ncbi:hypothetical protein [Streptomyces chattanoogensis]|uniref:hypothetical protein n=1 Tax=Streptomyces chattanoogensis TaxID=66876 RepID=UPI0036A45319
MVDFLDAPADIDRTGGFEELIAAVATIHTAPARWPQAVADTMAPWRLATTDRPAPGWIRDAAAWRRLLQLTAAAHGEDHVPLGHLDLKADHCRRRPDGHLALIDAETLRPDVTGLPDLITLAYLAQTEGRDLSPRAVRQVYRRCINDLGAQWSDAGLMNALAAFADATGLCSLHGVEQ